MSSGEVQLQDRDERILDHIARYRLTLRPVLDHVFFDPGSTGAGNVLQRLLGAGLIVARDGLPGRRRYYQLTAKGAAGRVSQERTKPMRAQALRSALAVLWFCHMLETRRRKIEKWELRDLLDGDPPPGTHCIEGRESPRLLRVQAPGPRTKPAAIVAGCKENIADARRHPIMKFWLKERRYGLAVLCEHERAAEIRSAIARHKLGQQAAITVEAVPGPHTLARAIHEHRTAEDAE